MANLFLQCNPFIYPPTERLFGGAHLCMPNDFYPQICAHLSVPDYSAHLSVPTYMCPTNFAHMQYVIICTNLLCPPICAYLICVHLHVYIFTPTYLCPRTFPLICANVHICATSSFLLIYANVSVSTVAALFLPCILKKISKVLSVNKALIVHSVIVDLIYL
jgi:hypothetical protein